MAEPTRNNIDWEPRVIKVSSKRQITIPAEVYEAAGFSDYALASWTEDGLVIQPIDVSDEDSSVKILRMLLAQGYDGEALIDEYEKVRRKIAAFDLKVGAALDDTEHGSVRSLDDVQKELREQ